jgi:hypothetical protein
MRWWGGERWSDRFMDAPGSGGPAPTPPGSPNRSGRWGGAPWWAWVLAVIVGGAIIAGIAGGDDSSNDGGSNAATEASENTLTEQPTAAGPELADEPTGDAEGTGQCPQQSFVGLPVSITLRVENTGDKTWPVTYLTIDDGADHFVFNNAHMGALVAEKVDTPAFDTWQLGSEGSGLRPGEKATIKMVLTPKDAGNRDLSYGVWGGPTGSNLVPDDLHLVSCSAIPVNP